MKMVYHVKHRKKLLPGKSHTKGKEQSSALHNAS
jgi:hypothetical protein